jgi:hypothetical protein
MENIHKHDEAKGLQCPEFKDKYLDKLPNSLFFKNRERFL